MTTAHRLPFPQVNPVNLDLAAVGENPVGEHFQQGRLAGAVVTDHRNQLALGHIKAGREEPLPLGIELGEVSNFKLHDARLTRLDELDDDDHKNDDHQHADDDSD